MKLTAAELGKLLNGTVEGNSDAVVSTVSKIEDAQAGSLTFLANPKYAPFLYSTNASIVIVGADLLLEKPVTSTLIRVKDPYSAFSVLLDMYNNSKVDKSGRERSEEHTSELQSLMRISYAVFCLKKKNIIHILDTTRHKNLNHEHT